MEKKSLSVRNFQPFLIAALVFLLLVSAAVAFTGYRQGQWEKDIRAQLLDVMIGKKSKLEKALYSRIFYTRGVAAYVALNPGISNEEYYELSKEYIRNDTIISSMALSRNCILNAIYPTEGHEAAIGLDLLAHPERREIVEKTIETRQTFVAGPVELVEGGVAFISYTPIFDKTKPDNPFWGVTDIVIKKQSLFNETSLTEVGNGYAYALKGYNGTGDNGEVFWGNADIFNQNPVKINIELPIGNWVLAAVPEMGWKQFHDQDRSLVSILFVSSFIISFLLWLILRAVLKIRQNERELKAIFASLDSLVIEVNRNGEYIKVASENQNLLVEPKETLIGKNFYDVFDKQLAEKFYKTVQKCLKTKKLFVIEYPLAIDGEAFWFSARVSFKNQNRVIINAYDITEKKKKEEQLKQSEKQLKELNEMKDKFFSVIAHDLRNPVAGQKSLIDLIVMDFENLYQSTLKEMLAGLQQSSDNLYRLLDNLLEWSKSQSGKISVNRQEVNINEIFGRIVPIFENLASEKNILLENELPPDLIIRADRNMTESVLRNLLSNAVKFTPKGGSINIGAEEVIIDDRQYLKISISDNGIGISSEGLKSLFSLDKTHSTSGTANEKGTGLGLILCREFVELQGGQLFVTSQINEGSTFSFTLPMEMESVLV